MDEQVLPNNEVLELLNEAESLKTEFSDFDVMSVAEFARTNGDKRNLQTLRDAYLFQKELESPLSRENIEQRMAISLTEGRPEPVTPGLETGQEVPGLTTNNLKNRMGEFLKVRMTQR